MSKQQAILSNAIRLFSEKGYSSKSFKADIVSGLTVVLVLIPQSMAYAALAGLPPCYGLYASFLPPMIAALFGSSRQLYAGPMAVVSLLTATSLEPLATSGSQQYIAYAILLALLVGTFQFSLGGLRFNGVRQAAATPKFYPPGEIPEKVEGDGRSWQFEVGNTPLFTHRLQLTTGGEVIGTVPTGLPAVSIPEIDASGEEALSLTIDRVRSAGIDISLSAVNRSVMKVLTRTHLIVKIGEDHIYPTIEAAISTIHPLTLSGKDQTNCPLQRVCRVT